MARNPVMACLTLAIAWLFFGTARALPPVQAPADSLLELPAELELSGNRQLSTLRLRRLLGAGRIVSAMAWRQRLDTLSQVYASLGRPFLDCQVVVDSSASPRRIRSLALDEGPLLVMGRLQLDPPRPDLPDLFLDLPPGTALRAGRLEEGLVSWLGRLNAAGRPLAVLSVKDLSLSPADDKGEKLALDLWLSLADADTIRPGRLVVLDSGVTRQRTFEKLARLRPGSPWDPARAADARRRLLATGWFSRLEGPGLCRTPAGLAWLLEAQELPSYRFDGLLAWLPGRGEESGRMGYHLSLELTNLVGTGRELTVLASRPEGWSQELRVAYREPFVAGWPVDAGMSVRQRVQDSTWVEQDLSASVGWEPRPGLRLEAGVVLRDLAPDSLNGYLLAGVDASSAIELRLAATIDRRDDPRNPRLGWTAFFEEALVRRQLESLRGLPPRGSDLDLRRQRFRAALWLPVGRRYVIHGNAGAGRFRGDAGERQPGVEDQFLLGGFEGPRGTRDQSLRAREWALGQLEWRLLLGPVSRAAVFWDLLIWRDAQLARHGLQGRGVALVLPVRQGQLELQYALTPGNRWREGLLHVRVIRRF